MTAHDAAGLTASDTFTVTPDTAPPAGGSVSYPDGYDADGTVTITVDAGTDALSGVNAASGVLERRTTALTGGVCGPFVGGWSPVTSPDTVPDGDLRPLPLPRLRPRRQRGRSTRCPPAR